MEIDLAKKYQTMITLWAALLMSVFIYFMVTLFAAPQISNEGNNPPNTPLIFALTALGGFLVIVSFAVKHKLLKQAIEKHDVGLVHKAMIIACAMCEASALLGVVERFVIGGREYYLLFLLAAVGMALHFPRRRDLESARWKPLPGSTPAE